MAVTPNVRVRVRVQGVVQGVGFRPFVYRLAGELGVGGFVRNDGGGVTIEAEGSPERVERFLARLQAEPPPLADVQRVSVQNVPALGETSFTIAVSGTGETADTFVAADTATCDDCVAELFDPADRRFRYPFINCTNCGPRFTIVRGVPYDRSRTTMAGFELCTLCSAEYDDPRDRRFHAQPTACPVCGPMARLVDSSGEAVALAGASDAVAAAARALLAGNIVAVKGIGGYHLACVAADEDAVRRLRGRKRREERPFAVMVRDTDGARALAHVGEDEEMLLESRARPIVLLRRRAGAAVAGAVAPRRSELGLMLPYSPVHHLLLADTGVPLVMTSGNVSDEPIAYDDDDALARLAGIADLFLMHDRPIERRVDDSVVRIAVVAGRRRTMLLRRSRGYVPEPLPLPEATDRHLLACGAQLKNTFCLARDGRAWVSHHIGDLENYETLRSYEVEIDQLERLFAVEPTAIAHDMHPDYLSTRYALDRAAAVEAGSAVPGAVAETALVPVQHHHAHLAACLEEHGVPGCAVGAIFDGTGFGPDGTVWGGEILVGDVAEFRRAGHLWPVRMPGGAAAIREPWRMACAWLVALEQATKVPAALESAVDLAWWRAVAHMAVSATSSPITTSVGRLCDAVAALCGVRAHVAYEGQAAIELEAVADREEPGVYPMPVIPGTDGEPLRIDARPSIRAVLGELADSEAVATIAGRFHNTLARATADACITAATSAGVDVVVLSGGVFQNELLLERTSAALDDAGLRVLVPERLPPNDGGISYGQAAVTAARLG